MAPTAAVPSPIVPNNYRAQVLHQHNIHRRNHSANAIAWDQDLTKIALDIAKSCTFAHNVTAGGGGYGQNIAAGTPPTQVAKIITNEFYNGEEPWFQGLYGLAQPPMTNFEHWGHFSQVVWNNSQTVGCATVKCPNGVKNVGSNVLPYFTVCNYKPPGNFQGQYGKNIGKPLGHPTVTIQ